MLEKKTIKIFEEINYRLHLKNIIGMLEKNIIGMLEKKTIKIFEEINCRLHLNNVIGMLKEKTTER